MVFIVNSSVSTFFWFCAFVNYSINNEKVTYRPESGRGLPLIPEDVVVSGTRSADGRVLGEQEEVVIVGGRHIRFHESAGTEIPGPAIHQSINSTRFAALFIIRNDISIAVNQKFPFSIRNVKTI